MSTDWDIRCVDCDELFGYDCGSPERLRKLMNIGPEWLVFHDRCRALGIEDVEVSFGGLQPDERDIRAHLGHRLVLHSEYGLDEGQCDLSRSLWSDPPCFLDKGHAGPCELRSRRRTMEGKE
jgi:hypothetical protein